MRLVKDEGPSEYTVQKIVIIPEAFNNGEITVRFWGSKEQGFTQLQGSPDEILEFMEEIQNALLNVSAEGRVLELVVKSSE